MRRSSLLFSMAVLGLIAAPVFAAPSAAELRPPKNIESAVSGIWRTAEYRARDQYRHPVETLTFFRVRPAAQLIEITPGGGWYTEILAPLLKEGEGSYTAAVVQPDKVPPAQRDYMSKARDALAAKFAAAPGLYDKAQTLEFDPQAPVFGPPASADIVLTFRNVHNWVQAGTEQGYFKAFYSVLKPGGVLGVVDHRAKAGAALDKSSGYLPEDYVIKLATDAGFRLDSRSEINANPKDTKDHPKGVWTLPPSLALGQENRAAYIAMGESDRFTLRFIKPAQ
jgi:predicted methyltransferase